MKKSKTQRGFVTYDFLDEYNQKCSLTKSSLAEKDCIWLGVDQNLKQQEVIEHMHLNRKQVKALLPILTKFVKTGEV